MAIDGYRTIPTDGSGELYSWPGCVVLVSQLWSDGPAFAERVAATDHDDAAPAFRDLAGWLLARSGDEVADFAAVIQVGPSLLCMAAGEAVVTLGDGRSVSSDVSGMWAQLVLAERPDRIELGVSAGVAPERIDLADGVVQAQGALLVGRGPAAAAGGTEASVGAAAPTAASSGTAGGVAAGESTPPVATGGTPEGATASAATSAATAATSTAPVGRSVGGVARPGTGTAGRGADQADPRRTEGAAPTDAPDPHVAAAEVANETDTDADVTGDPRGSPADGNGPAARQDRHQLPFDADLDDGQPTDAEGLIGIVSEEPEPSGTSGSEANHSARSGTAVADAPEPTGEHRSASSFGDEEVAEEPLPEPDGSDEAAGGESTGLVPIVTTPSVPGADPMGSVTAEPDQKAGRPGGRSPRGRASGDDQGSWPPPPAWATEDGDAEADAADEDVDEAPSAPEADWAADPASYDEVGAADADLATATRENSAVTESAPRSDSGDDTNEREWDSDGLEDDTSIPLLLFDDGVAVELPGDVLIGRRPDPGVRDDPSRLHTLTMTDDSQAVSRNHVELRRRDDEVSIVDCGSANGTFVEATPGELTRLDAEAPHVLRDGERVVFGKRWFEYRAPRSPGSDA